MSEFMLDVGQANELKLTFRKAKWKQADIKKFCEGDLAFKLLPVVRGFGNVVVTKHIIDCDIDPYIPKGWTVESHRKGGQFEWDAASVGLYSPKQFQFSVIEGNKIRHDIEMEQIINANVLDYLLVYPELIPESWKGKGIFFWGTIYRDFRNRLVVRCLCFQGEHWVGDYRPLCDDFSFHSNKAAVRR